MKLVSWNVNGLRACIQKGFLDEFEKFNADFFCLQETKLSEGQLELDLPGYHQYWCYSQKKGYSGTAIFARHEPQSVQYGIGVEDLDNEGRVITLEYPEFFLVTCYTPNAQRELARIDHRMKWDDAFRAFLQRLDAQKPVILCGDLNVAHKEIDLKNPAANRGNAGFSDQERESFQKTLDLGFTDTFRHLHPDKTGAYSWWSYMFHAREKNAGWRIDYFLVSDRIRESLYRAEIHSDVLGSDHCPVSIHIDLLVNGSLYTHETTGKPRVVEAEPTKKSAKSSAVSAKDFASILPIVMVLCLAISLLAGWLRDRHGTIDAPPQTTPQLLQLHFEVVIYEQPFYDYPLWDESESAPSDDLLNVLNLPDGTVLKPLLAADGTSYYVPVDLPFSINDEKFNVYMRITGTTDGLDYDSDRWEIGLKGEEEGFASSVITDKRITDIFTVPYYDPDDLAAPAGWLLWGQYSFLLPSNFTLTVKHPDAVSAFEETLSILPYLDRIEVQNLTTAELLAYVSHYSDIVEGLRSLSNIPFSSTPEAFLQLVDRYIPLQYLINRYDLINHLMNQETPANSLINNILLSIMDVQLRMTADEEYQYLTGSYSTCNWTLDFTHTGANPENIAIRYVFQQILELNSSSILVRCRHEKNIPYIYEFLRARIPAFKALEKRYNVVEELMNTAYFERDHGILGPISKMPSILLSLPVYQEKMTDQQKALYITGNYNSSGKDRPGPVYVELPIFTTEQLYDRMLSWNNTGEYFAQAENVRVAYYIYVSEHSINQYMEGFFIRDDALEVLESYGDELLIHLYYYLWEQTRLCTDDQVANMILQDQEMISRLYTSELSSHDRFLLAELASRTGAIDYIMDMAPYEDGSLKTLPYTLLFTLDFYHPGTMTPQQEAKFICNTYNSCHLAPITFPEVEGFVHLMTAEEIVEILIAEQNLLASLFSRCTTIEAKIEVFSILSWDSDFLQNLYLRTNEVVQILQSRNDHVLADLITVLVILGYEIG